MGRSFTLMLTSIFSCSGESSFLLQLENITVKARRKMPREKRLNMEIEVDVNLLISRKKTNKPSENQGLDESILKV